MTTLAPTFEMTPPDTASAGLNFGLSSDQRLIVQTVREFCQAKIAPLSAEYDRSGEYPREQLRGLAELGLLGATVPEAWGGAGLDSVTYALCLEEIAAADASVAVIVSVQNGRCCWGTAPMPSGNATCARWRRVRRWGPSA